jgi:hypothetical protein
MARPQCDTPLVLNTESKTVWSSTLYNFFSFFPFQLLGSIFLPFVQSNKLDLQYMDIAQDYIEMLQCMGVSQNIYKKEI